MLNIPCHLVKQRDNQAVLIAGQKFIWMDKMRRKPRIALRIKAVLQPINGFPRRHCRTSVPGSGPSLTFEKDF